MTKNVFQVKSGQPILTLLINESVQVEPYSHKPLSRQDTNPTHQRELPHLANTKVRDEATRLLSPPIKTDLDSDGNKLCQESTEYGSSIKVYGPGPSYRMKYTDGLHSEVHPYRYIRCPEYM